MENLTDKIRTLLGKFDTAMLVTHDGDGPGRARPMAIAKIEVNCDLWFFTALHSGKTHEIENDQNVLLVFQNDHRAYLSLAGRASLVVDRAQAAALWKDSYKTWFPGGVDDPELSLIRVAAMEVEYWDNTGFKGVKYLFEAAKAYVSGERPRVNEPEQHGRVTLK